MNGSTRMDEELQAERPSQSAVKATHAAPLRVLKLGGSLLSQFDVISALISWLARQAPSITLVVVGGGELADAVRTLDQHRGLTSASAHWQAIGAMRVNAFVLSQLWLETEWVERVGDWLAGPQRTIPAVAIVDPWSFLAYEEPNLCGQRLPCGWHVTSDSIAARLAASLRADELVLLKSTLPDNRVLPRTLLGNGSETTTVFPAPVNLPSSQMGAGTAEVISEPFLSCQQAADAGLVDHYFPVAARELLNMRAVNLRASGWPSVRLVPSTDHLPVPSNGNPQRCDA